MSISSTDLNPAAGKGPTGRHGMPSIRANHAGLVTAALFAVWHLVWSTFVATGVAQPIIDFVFWMHFIKPVYIVEPFSAGRAVTLVVVTAIVGYILGSAFALLWNRLRR